MPSRVSVPDEVSASDPDGYNASSYRRIQLTQAQIDDVIAIMTLNIEAVTDWEATEQEVDAERQQQYSRAMSHRWRKVIAVMVLIVISIVVTAIVYFRTMTPRQ